ncbi:MULTISPECIES: HIT family protein [unclassified Rathayibacter]|uniref:HIT family protein n=1 Tax=unclassified Rathayibacter TaxID=2609250 RepID=UPI0006F919FA|nr:MULTISPECIES: HIT domain-containing protein [unclassified Rathayibacter]KQQ05577.1 hypothetical protein ASF42_03135 [Rathayibacter sp. Leaf294]KQS13438.1 hypothetical protein ASG06_03145 [Rathayibacter sp. Leaf185]
MADANEHCIFCVIAEADPHGQTFYEDEHVVAFLDIAPAAEGHALVVPRRHAADVLSITSDDFAAVARGAHAVAALLNEEMRPDGLTIVQSNGTAAGQDVLHLHVHVIPRFASDALVPPWNSSPAGAVQGVAQLTDALRRRVAAQ